MFVKLAFLLVLGLAFEKVYADEPDRVVGGTDASLGEFPYQVSLQYYGRHICGGSIISERHIATAAHCVDDIADGPLDDFRVMTGAVKLDSPDAQLHKVERIRVYPDYMDDISYAWVHDAAIITLAEPLQFNANQKPIPLATSDPPANAALTLSGWGQLGASAAGPNNLQKATVYYLENEKCEKYRPGMPLYPTHLCANQPRGIGACMGDSGGPLAYNGELVGIVSWVTPCARGIPDVFTRVTLYNGYFDGATRDETWPPKREAATF